MSKRKKLSATSEAVDAAFGVLDDALRATGRLLATDEESVRNSESEIDLESVDLPEALRDPMEVLRRGREILERGFSSDRKDAPTSQARRALAHAARNGQSISGDLQRQMHEDRNTARNKKKEA